MWGRTLLNIAAFARAPREQLRRLHLARQCHCPAPIAIDRRTGYALLPPGCFADFERIRTSCLQLFETKRAKIDHEVTNISSLSPDAQAKFRASKRKFLRNLLNNDDLRRHPELVDFALSNPVLGIAMNYLGTIPYLNRIDLLYSVPRDADDHVASQLFHVDPEGLMQVKFFINLFDVGEAEGPFTFIPADHSSRILKGVGSLRSREGNPGTIRYTDEEIVAVGGTDAIIAASGPSGGGVAIDTSRCLHLGSRVRAGSSRLCLYLQYCTSHEPGNVFDHRRFRNDAVRYLAVAHSAASAGVVVRAPHESSS
jgi:hypothetical protein